MRAFENELMANLDNFKYLQKVYESLSLLYFEKISMIHKSQLRCVFLQGCRKWWTNIKWLKITPILVCCQFIWHLYQRICKFYTKNYSRSHFWFLDNHLFNRPFLKKFYQTKFVEANITTWSLSSQNVKFRNYFI